MGNCIGPAVTSAGSVHAIRGGSPESPGIGPVDVPTFVQCEYEADLLRFARRNRGAERDQLRRQVLRLHRPRSAVANHGNLRARAHPDGRAEDRQQQCENELPNPHVPRL